MSQLNYTRRAPTDVWDIETESVVSSTGITIYDIISSRYIEHCDVYLEDLARLVKDEEVEVWKWGLRDVEYHVDIIARRPAISICR